MVTNKDDDIDYDDDDDDDGEDNENDRVGPQHVRLKVHGGFATLLNDLQGMRGSSRVQQSGKVSPLNATAV